MIRNFTSQYYYGFFSVILLWICYLIICVLLALFVISIGYVTNNTFYYLFSAMAQTLGAIIALSATFFVLMYDPWNKNKNDYYIRLIKILKSFLNDSTVDYIKLYNQYLDNEILLSEQIRSFYMKYKNNSMVLFHAISVCSLDYNFIHENMPGSYYSEFINNNLGEYKKYFYKLKNLKSNIKKVYICNLTFISILIICLTLSDVAFDSVGDNNYINEYGVLMLLIGLIVFIYGLVIIGRSILKTIKE